MATKKPAAAEVPAMSTTDMASAMSKAGFKLFAERTGLPLNQAQRNLEGRTHYVDDSTLKSFAAKIHTVHVMDDGLVLGLVESVQKGFNAADGRVFRPVFFDLFGRIIHRPEIDDSFDSQKQAMSSFWKEADEIDAVEETRNGLREKCEVLTKELGEVQTLLEELKD
jgi:hypothetical protein